MERKVPIILAAAGILAMGVVSPVFGQEQTMTAGWASTAPALDGTLGDGEWTEAARINFDGTDAIRPGAVGPDSETIGGPNGDGFQSAEDSSVVVYVMNDGANLYVAIDATDDILDFSLGDVWRNDGVEIRVDGNFSRSSSKEGDMFGYCPCIRGDGGATASFPSGGDMESAAAAKPDGSGWIVEFRSSTAGYEPMVGFDIAIDDSDDPNSQSRDSQYRWNGDVDAGWNDETQWGALILATEPNPGPMLQLESGLATSSPTLDGVLDAGEWADATAIAFDGNDAVRPGVVGPDSGTIGGPNGDGFQLYEDSHVVAYIMNDARNLYVAIDATDDILDFSLSDVWRNDGVEIRVDGNFSRSDPKEGDMFGYAAVIRGDGGATASFPTGDLESGAAAKPDGSGWIIEFRSSTEGYEPVVGFDIAINDSDDPNSDDRDSQYRLNGDVDGGWNNETQWAELKLVGARSSAVERSVWELYE